MLWLHPPPRRRRMDRTPMTTSLTHADAIVLSLLVEREMHGYEIGQEYDRTEVRDWAMVSKAQVYYAIKKLGTAGHIAPVDGGADPDPRGKTVFRVTEAGRAALAEVLRDESWIAERRPQPFTTWVGLSIDVDVAARGDMIDRRRAHLTAELARERDSLAQVAAMEGARPKVGERIIALTIRQIETELNWLETL